MAEKSSSEGKMFCADEMRSAISTLAGERRWHETRESWLSGAARKAGISYRQAKAFFYGEARNPSVETVERVRAALKHQPVGTGFNANEIQELRTLVERLEAVVDRSNHPALRENSDRIRDVARRARIRIDRMAREET